MFWGAINKIIGKNFALGAQFEEGFMAMFSLTLPFFGILSLAPLLAKLFSPLVFPISPALPADPALFPTTLLSNDLLCFSLSQPLPLTPHSRLFSAAILSSFFSPPTFSY
ncbi:ethanolamine utilization protein EutH, partial [Listeria monocytogenes]|uniref:ethanolamine utilization protein EutH n=1 Tax=Listeria monocytogenes TaxID=1639 RepID=UPI000E75D8BA